MLIVCGVFLNIHNKMSKTKKVIFWDYYVTAV